MIFKNIHYQLRTRCFLPNIIHRSYVCQSAGVNNFLLERFSENERERVLNFLNSLAEDTSNVKIGARQLKSVRSFLKEKKEFKNFDQLLQLHGFGPQVLENMCNVILNKDTVLNKTKSTVSKAKTSFITPSLDEAQKKEIRTVTGIQIGNFNISYASFDIIANTLTDWMLVDFINTTDAKNLNKIYKFVVSLKESIPQSDVYVMESKNWNLLSAQTSLLLHMRAAQTTAMLIALLNRDQPDDESSPDEGNRVHLLKSYLPTRYFKTLIGSESVSPQKMVEDMFDGNFMDFCMSFNITDNSKSNYYSKKKPMRENLCQSLLLTLTFIEVILNNKTEHLKSKSKVKM